ncbi:MAG: hypothetical protein SPI25_03355, partial [Dialister sp.]|nr:hypothetical protein [Dialister sp.]
CEKYHVKLLNLVVKSRDDADKQRVWCSCVMFVLLFFLADPRGEENPNSACLRDFLCAGAVS